jgi:tetratricopeptide (TPR) repeat protein
MVKREAGKAMARKRPRSSSGREGLPALHTVVLGGLSALLVATPLVPSESTAELGVGANWIMALLMLCAGWLVAVVVRRADSLCWGAIDWLAGLFVALVFSSAWVMAGQGCARATINMAWQWGGLGILFLLARQWLRPPTAVRAISSVMIGLAVCLTVVAYHQYFVSLPKTRAEFARHPDALLREAGIDAGPDSPERKLFEDRLNSTEPLATFALANSLAGFLAPWFLVAWGIAAAAWGGGDRATAEKAGTSRQDMQTLLSPERVRRVALVAGAAAVFIGFCLLLTKSRTALLAVGLGLGLLAASRWPLRRWFTWRILAAAGVVFGLLAAALTAGVWDRLVLTETPKSLLYRFQYWEATAAMIADYPWLGSGPGNFQHYYAAYKLPEASESIADPHNLFFEVAATAGLPAVLVFVALLAAVAWHWPPLPGLATDRRASDTSLPAVPSDPPDSSDRSAAWPADEAAASAIRGAYLGALAGVVLGWWTGFVFGMPPEPMLFLLGLPAAVAVVAALHPWTRYGPMPPAVPAIAWLVLSVNLLAAGGISFAGIGPSWWLLLAIVSNSAIRPLRERRIGRFAASLLAVLAVLLVVGCFLTLYSPVLRCRAKLEEGLSLVRLQRLEEAEAAFHEAAAADRYSAEPWNNLAALHHSEAAERHSEVSLSRFEAALEQAVQRNPRAPTLRKQIGDWWLALFARWGERRYLEESIGAYAQWVRLYPNQALGHAQLGWAYHLAGDGPASLREASQALRLDALNPHIEKTLGRQRLYDPVGDSEGQRENAEQTIRRLRNY